VVVGKEGALGTGVGGQDLTHAGVRADGGELGCGGHADGCGWL
jgi:hypothetical protein